jgi:hypothetical protein
VTEEWETGTPVTKTGYESSYRGFIVGYETKYKTRWAIVKWSHLQFTEREYPEALTQSA